MVQTLLVKTLIEEAEEVMNEFGGEYLTASHIVVAIADFCKTRYNGLNYSYLAYPRFEEERIRYIFQKEVKLAGYLRLALSINTKNNVVENEFDFEPCKRVALARGADILSADVLFVCAMVQLGESHKRALSTISTEETVYALLEDADNNVYDFTIARIEDVCGLLMKKSKEAARIRDWKPAEKFVEPEELLKQLFENIRTCYVNNVLHITFSGFLLETDLKLNIYKVNDGYMIHDNGSAVACLLKRIDRTKIGKILDVIWGDENFQDDKIFTKITDTNAVLYYIQEVILTAYADLYFEYFREEEFGRRRYIEPCSSFESEDMAQKFDADAFLDTLKKSVSTHYDENKGLTLRLATKYCNCSCGINVLIETLDDGTLRLSDGYKNQKYETGEMLEAFYFGSRKEEEDMYYRVMTALAQPFSMQFDMSSSIIFPEYRGQSHNHKNPYMLSVPENWLIDFYKFMNSAVLMSVVADRIDCEKIREW